MIGHPPVCDLKFLRLGQHAVSPAEIHEEVPSRGNELGVKLDLPRRGRDPRARGLDEDGVLLQRPQAPLRPEERDPVELGDVAGLTLLDNVLACENY